MKTFLYSLSFTLLLTSCGIHKLAEETRDEVKKSNDQITMSNEEIKKSNEKQDQMIKRMEETIRQMHITNNGVHLQVLVDSMRGMQAPENTDNLILPVRMLPFAETFAKEATAEEILQIFHLYYLDARKGCPDLECNPEALKEEELRVKGRTVSYTSVMLIAAFASQEKVDHILKQEVEIGGRYKDSALALASARYEGIANLRLKSIWGSENFERASLAEAVLHFNSMKNLALRSYSGRMVVNLPAIVKKVTVSPTGERVTSYESKRHEVRSAELWAAWGRPSNGLFRTKLKAQLGEAVLEEPEIKANLAQFLQPAN